MITPRPQELTPSAEVFAEALEVITASGAADLIDSATVARRGPGGRPPAGIRYTVLGLLVAVYIRIRLRQPVTIATLFHLLVVDFTDDQRAALGVSVVDGDKRAEFAGHEGRREYARFHAWATRALVVLDANADVVARRTTVAERDAVIAARTPEQLLAAAAARDLTDLVMNRLVAASIVDKAPADYRGDIVIDESTFDTSKLGPGQGGKAHHRRPAAPAAGAYARAGGVIQDGTVKRRKDIQKAGCGVGVTAVIRVPAPGGPVTFPPLTTAIAVAPPRSANVDAARRALAQHRGNGFDPQTRRKAAPNARRPQVTTDMAYNAKQNWTELLADHGYDPVMRYPANFRVKSFSEPVGAAPSSAHPGGPGPLMIEGSWYCPAVQTLTIRRLGTRLRDIRDYGAHDAQLRARLAHLMGLNGAVRRAAATRGRPRADTPPEMRDKIALVCPAAQARVRCPLRPESLPLDARDHYTVRPDFEASTYECCNRNQVTVTMTPQQSKTYQRALPAGSWEHALAFEEMRAMNERVFSIVKSPHLTDVSGLTHGARREPLQMLTLAITFAVANVALQRHFRPGVSTYRENWKRLEQEIGAPPTRIPNLS